MASEENSSFYQEILESKFDLGLNVALSLPLLMSKDSKTFIYDFGDKVSRVFYYNVFFMSYQVFLREKLSDDLQALTTYLSSYGDYQGVVLMFRFRRPDGSFT